MGNEYYYKPSAHKPLINDSKANVGMSVLYFKKLLSKY